MAQAIDKPTTGHDGPYDAPTILGPWQVEPDWIDYNGHMNVACYTKAFDQAMDAICDEHLGIGESFAQQNGFGPYVLQLQTHFLAEMHEGETFTFALHLLDCDAKRLHVAATMKAEDGREAAHFEALFINVDLSARKPAAYPEWAHRRLERMRADHAGLPHPQWLSAPIGIRRKS